MKLWITAIIISLILLACSEDNASEGQQHELQKNQTLWNEQNIGIYQYNIKRSCFCPIENGVLVKVDNNTITEVIDALDGSQRDLRNTYATTIVGLFAEIEAALANEQSSVNVEYHSVYGYPKHIYIDRMITAIDDEVGYSINHMRINETTYSEPLLLWDLSRFQNVQNSTFSIESISIVDDILSLRIISNTSCGNAYFDLAISQTSLKTSPPQTETLLLQRPDNDKLCDSPQAYFIKYELQELKAFLLQNNMTSPLIIPLKDQNISYTF